LSSKDATGFLERVALPSAAYFLIRDMQKDRHRYARGGLVSDRTAGGLRLVAGGLYCLREVEVFLTHRPAKRPYDVQLLFGEVKLALGDIGFAEILPDLDIMRVQRDRFEIIADAFFGAAELAGDITAIVEGLWRVGFCT